MRNSKHRFDVKRQNYLKKIMDDKDRGVLSFVPGTVNTLHVYHDEWCKSFKGGDCNCNPDIVQEVAK